MIPWISSLSLSSYPLSHTGSASLPPQLCLPLVPAEPPSSALPQRRTIASSSPLLIFAHKLTGKLERGEEGGYGYIRYFTVLVRVGLRWWIFIWAFRRPNFIPEGFWKVVVIGYGEVFAGVVPNQTRWWLNNERIFFSSSSSLISLLSNPRDRD